MCSLAHLLTHPMFVLWYVNSLICLFGCSCIGSSVCKLFTCLFMRLPVRSFPLRSVANLVMPCPCEDRTCQTGTCGRSYDVITRFLGWRRRTKVSFRAQPEESPCNVDWIRWTTLCTSFTVSDCKCSLVLVMRAFLIACMLTSVPIVLFCGITFFSSFFRLLMGYVA